MTNLERAAGLRALADFYETHPEMPLGNNNVYIWAWDRPAFLKAVNELKDGGEVTITDKPDSSEVMISRDFGGALVEIHCNKKHCGRKVIKNMDVEVFEVDFDTPEEPAAVAPQEPVAVQAAEPFEGVPF